MGILDELGMTKDDLREQIRDTGLGQRPGGDTPLARAHRLRATARRVVADAERAGDFWPEMSGEALLAMAERAVEVAGQELQVASESSPRRRSRRYSTVELREAIPGLDDVLREHRDETVAGRELAAERRRHAR